jgi:lysophospholipase L1-like esterase
MPPLELDLPEIIPGLDQWGGKNTAALLTLLQAVNNTIASLDVRSGHLWSIHTDGTENDLGALPVAPGGTDAGVASYLEAAGSLSGAATKALVASDIEDGGPVGDAVSAQNAATLAARSRQTAIIMGDSIAAQNGGPRLDATNLPVDPYQTLYARGPFVWANLILGQRWTIIANAGWGGQRTDQVLARFDEAVIARLPGWVLINCGTNDVSQSRPAADIIANWTAMFEKGAAAGIRVVACTITSQSGFDTTKLGVLNEANAWLRRYARNHPNVIVAETNEVIADPTSGVPLAGRTVDGTHPSQDGAALMGLAIADAVDRALTPIPIGVTAADPLNLSPNPTMKGASGSATGFATASGSFADGFTVFAGNSADTVTGTKVARTDGVPGEWQQLDVATTTVAANVQSATIALPASITPGTDTAWAEWEFECDTYEAAGSDGVGLNVTVEWRGSSGSVGTSAQALQAGSSGDARLGVLPRRGRLRTNLGLVPANATGFRLILSVRATTARLRLGRNHVRKGPIAA